MSDKYLPTAFLRDTNSDNVLREITGAEESQMNQEMQSSLVKPVKCDSCGNMITARTCVKISQPQLMHFHNACFRCSSCEKAILSVLFSMKPDGKLLCGFCSQLHESQKKEGPACAKCQKPIQTGGVQFQGSKYHSECFVCACCAAKPTSKRIAIDRKTNLPVCEECIKTGKRPSAAAPAPAAASSASGSLDDLEKLAGLKAKGIITQEEFDLKKKQILGLQGIPLRPQ